MTATEADAGEALWRRLTIPEKERRKLINAYRDAVLHAAAEKIRAAHQDLPAEFWAAKSTGAACANLIDPEMEAKRAADRLARGEQR